VSTSSPIVLSVIVPVRNGEDRLPGTLRTLAEFRRAQADPTEVILVDDGSGAPAARLLDEAAGSEGFTLLRNDENHGKGFSVARGLQAARGAYRVFTDADLAYPVEEVVTVMRALQEGADVAIACRVLPESRYLMSPAFFHYLYTRHLMSRAYNALVRRLLLPGVLDSQAGLKGLRAAAAERIGPRLTIPGFGFDVELLFLARKYGFRTVQLPVSYRYDDEPTTVRLMGDGWRMAKDLARIRVNDWRGRYA
jgi:dolichyl-phosphate beta-glucosyltransferase